MLANLQNILEFQMRLFPNDFGGTVPTSQQLAVESFLPAWIFMKYRKHQCCFLQSSSSSISHDYSYQVLALACHCE